MHELLDTVLHLDKALEGLTSQYGPWIYGILFAIVFAETGFVVTPFLPGDSLLFAVGTLSGTGVLKLQIAMPLLFCAAVLGNTCNYHIGKFVGPRVFRGGAGTGLLARLMSRQHLARAHVFFEKYGGKAVTLGQFVPIVRTFVPFVAGAGAMTYRKFLVYNVIGACAWVGICCGAGALFGKLQIVRDNFSLAILAIIIVSLIPFVIEFLKARRAHAAGPAVKPASPASHSSTSF